MWFLLFDRQTHYKKTTQRGFTLIELMLVIALMGVVAFLAVSSFDGDQRESRINVTRLEMVELRKALLQFRRDTREMPCQVYKEGNYNPFFNNQAVAMDVSETPPTGHIDFRSSDPGNPTNPAKPSSQGQFYDWCQDSLVNDQSVDVIQADNALSMLVRFPYDNVTDPYRDLLWNQDTKIGWNGPYIDKNGLKDAWGEPYKLIDSALAFGQNYVCEATSASNGTYATFTKYTGESGEHESINCIPAKDVPVADEDLYYLPGDIVRLVSTGPNGRLDTTFDETTLTASNPDDRDDPCSPDPDTDDLVLCLLR